jgi:acyl-CoA synthetase (AMP-forming)/AMP-acid ligase II
MMPESRFSFDATTTVVDVLHWRAKRHPERTAFVFLADGETETQRITYGQLHAQASSVAVTLLRVAPEAAAVPLVFAPGLDFLAAFWGCLLAGKAAVPCYPPDGPRAQERLLQVLRGVGATVGLTQHAILDACAGRLGAERSAVLWLASDRLAPVDAPVGGLPSRPDGVAVLQYTSGSTSSPKGVQLTYENLRGSIQVFIETVAPASTLATARQLTDDPPSPCETFVSWLPHNHDMGLFGKIVYPVSLGATTVQMPPVAFLQKPARWLRAMTRYRGTLSAAPNFAYDLCTRRIGREEAAALDLTAWGAALNAAETVRATTLQRFVDAFEPAGFSRHALCPCYGLAEATLIVTGDAPGTPLVTKSVSRAELAHGTVAPPHGDPDTITYVACGVPHGGHDVVLVDPETGVLARPGTVGEIWIRGPAVAPAYWREDHAAGVALRSRLGDTGPLAFVRTGDLGFMEDGRLYITGRLKEVIIVRGQNHYPEDIEATVAEVAPIFRRGGGVAFALPGDREEEVVVLQEIERGADSVPSGAIKGAVAHAVARHHGIGVRTLLFLKAGSLPKTTSGKLQRRLSRDLFLNGHFSAYEVGRDAARD